MSMSNNSSDEVKVRLARWAVTVIAVVEEQL